MLLFYVTETPSDSDPKKKKKKRDDDPDRKKKKKDKKKKKVKKSVITPIIQLLDVIMDPDVVMVRVGRPFETLTTINIFVNKRLVYYCFTKLWLIYTETVSSLPKYHLCSNIIMRKLSG